MAVVKATSNLLKKKKKTSGEEKRLKGNRIGETGNEHGEHSRLRVSSNNRRGGKERTHLNLSGGRKKIASLDVEKKRRKEAWSLFAPRKINSRTS